MKCHACGAESALSTKFCEYCGVAVVATAGAPPLPVRAAVGAAAPASQSATAADSIWPTLADPIFHLWQKSGTNPFRWLAFIFPIGYLAGYGSERAAIGLGGMFLLASIAAKVLSALHVRTDIALTVFVLLYSWRVATHVDSLAPRRTDFHWGKAIGFTLLYAIVVGVGV